MIVVYYLNQILVKARNLLQLHSAFTEKYLQELSNIKSDQSHYMRSRLL